MNDPRRGELADYVAAHFAAEDAERSAWLDRAIPEFIRRSHERRENCQRCGDPVKRRKDGKPWCPRCVGNRRRLRAGTP